MRTTLWGVTFMRHMVLMKVVKNRFLMFKTRA